MSLQSAADVPLLISSPNSSSERRISPSWSIAHLKSRLEPITGVPASSQQLSLRIGSQDAVPITAPDEGQTPLAHFPLQPYAEITVSLFDLASPIAATQALRPSASVVNIVGILLESMACLKSAAGTSLADDQVSARLPFAASAVP